METSPITKMVPYDAGMKYAVVHMGAICYNPLCRHLKTHRKPGKMRKNCFRIKPQIAFPNFAKSITGPLAVIMIVYLVLAVSYAVLTPPWEAPDEPAHYRYVVQLAERWRPPPDPMVRQRDRFCRDYIYTSSNYEWYHPALGYLSLAAAYKILKVLAPHSLPVSIPPFNPLFCSDPFTYPNLFYLETHSPIEIWRHQWGLLVLRISSSLWGLVIIFATYRVGQMGGLRLSAIVASSWVAFLPQFVFISASVRNDTLNNTLAALLFLLVANALFSKVQHPKFAITMGLVVGIGMLTKITFAYLIPVALLAIIWSSSSPKKQIGSALCVVGLSLTIVALYYLNYPEARASLYYMSTQMKINPRSLSWSYWKPFFPMLLDLFFARFGWANVPLPSWWIRTAFGIWTLGASLSVYHTIRLSKYQKNSPEIYLMLLSLASLILAFAGVIRYNLSVFQPQGRFLFPALVGWAHLGTWGILTSLPKWARHPVALAMMGYMFLFNLRALISLVSTYY